MDCPDLVDGCWVAVPGRRRNLPIEVETDLLLVRIERAIVNEEHQETLSLLSELRQMDPAADVVELSFFEAVAAQETGDLDRAEEALTRFVTMEAANLKSIPALWR